MSPPHRLPWMQVALSLRDLETRISCLRGQEGDWRDEPLRLALDEYRGVLYWLEGAAAARLGELSGRAAAKEGDPS